MLALRSGFRLEKGADAQGDLLLVGVDGRNLRVDRFANGEDFVRLADAAVGDLGDVDEAVNARHVGVRIFAVERFARVGADEDAGAGAVVRCGERRLRKDARAQKRGGQQPQNGFSQQ